jgi:hypothetical protein
MPALPPPKTTTSNFSLAMGDLLAGRAPGWLGRIAFGMRSRAEASFLRAICW